MQKKQTRHSLRTGKCFMVLGLFLLLASFSLTLYNFYDERQAAASVDRVLLALDEADKNKVGGEADGSGEKGDGSAMSSGQNGDGIPDGNGTAGGAFGFPDGFPQDSAGELVIPDYILNPDIPMPETVVEGNAYIGKLELPELGLRLPVMSEWSYPKLKKAPCCYQGSAYTGDLIIAGHNYKRHFNGLKRLKTGSRVILTDEAGNVFRYHVSKIERLDGYAVEEMEAGDWDLTLFTCTLGGSVRLTLRCKLEEG